MNPKTEKILIISGIIGLILILGSTAGYFFWNKINQPINNNQLVGGDKDEHGCIGSAGYTWCEVKNKCLRTWEEECVDEDKDKIYEYYNIKIDLSDEKFSLVEKPNEKSEYILFVPNNTNNQKQIEKIYLEINKESNLQDFIKIEEDWFLLTGSINRYLDGTIGEKAYWHYPYEFAPGAILIFNKNTTYEISYYCEKVTEEIPSEPGPRERCEEYNGEKILNEFIEHIEFK